MLKTSLICLCLTALSGCGAGKALVVAPAPPILLSPPDALMQDCPPLYKGAFNTVRDLNTALTQAENARNQCQAEKVALRRWQKETVAAIPVK